MNFLVWPLLFLGPITAVTLIAARPTAQTWLLKVRGALEIAAVTSAMLLVGWAYNLRTLINTPGLSHLGQAFVFWAAFWSILRLANGVLVIETIHSATRAARSLALLGLSLSGSAFELLMWNAWANRAVPNALVLVGLAAVAASLLFVVFRFRESNHIGRVVAAPTHTGSRIPYVMVFGAIGLAVPRLIVTGAIYDVIVTALCAGMGITIIARQYVMLQQNQSMAQELEARMDLRDAQLEAREHFRALIQHSSDLIMTITNELTVTYASESSQAVLGFTAESLLNMNLSEFLDDSGSNDLRLAIQRASVVKRSPEAFDLIMRHQDGHELCLSTTVTYLPDEPSVEGVVVNMRDVTSERELEDQLEHQAFHDALTDLPNRALFKDRLLQAVNRINRREEAFALIYCDLDGFKAVNDTAGHAAGDDLLVEASKRMLDAVRAGDTVARLGGDEFSILLEDADENTVNLISDRIVKAMAQPFAGTETDANLVVSASLGVVMVDGSERHDVGELMRDADLAMYVAKSMGKNRHVRFETNMRDKFVSEVALRNDLREAIENNGLELHYQPIIALDTNVMSSVEALLRWNHHERGFIPPLDFIPMAEETGMIIPIGEFVLRTACNEIAELQRRQPDTAPRSVAVNVSGRQLEESNFVPMVKEIVATSGLPVSSLTLEVTESMLIDGGNGVLERLQELHDYGVKFAIDDFGTGYSSLNYLRQFPIDILKVDRAFVSGLGTAQQDSMLTNAILTIGRTLQLRTVAEGIETQNELDELNRIGCDMGQGYLFARPLPLAALNEMVDEQAYTHKA